MDWVFRDLARCHSNGTVSCPEAATQRALSRGRNPVSDKLGRIWRSHDGLHVLYVLYHVIFMRIWTIFDLRFLRLCVRLFCDPGPEAMRCNMSSQLLLGTVLIGRWLLSINNQADESTTRINIALRVGHTQITTQRTTHNINKSGTYVVGLAGRMQRSGKGFIRLS